MTANIVDARVTARGLAIVLSDLTYFTLSP